MTIAPERLMTADEFFCMPDDGKLYELVAGRLEEVGGASPRSSAVAVNISSDLNAFVRARKLGVVGGAGWGVKLFSNPDTVRVPDVVFVRQERLPGGKVPIRFQDGAPDLVVEVLSPSDRFRRTARKVREYLASEHESDGVLDGEDVVPGFTLNLADIWVDAEDQA